jgi:hypothetical protein
MKTPIADPIAYQGWTIHMYLEKGGFSFRITPPTALSFASLEDGCIYTTAAAARFAAKKLVNIERVALSLRNWLAEMYLMDKLSMDEFEALCYSTHDIYRVEGGK